MQCYSKRNKQWRCTITARIWEEASRENSLLKSFPCDGKIERVCSATFFDLIAIFHSERVFYVTIKNNFLHQKYFEQININSAVEMRRISVACSSPIYPQIYDPQTSHISHTKLCDDNTHTRHTYSEKTRVEQKHRN